METLSYTDARNRLRELIEQVTENHEVVRISRRNGQAVVILSESDYEGLRETLHLLSNPVNAERLLAARRRGPSETISLDEARKNLDL